MKKVLALGLLCALAIGASAQEKKKVVTNKVTKTFVSQPYMIYGGASLGFYGYNGEETPHNRDSKYPYEAEGAFIGLRGGYLHSLVGNINARMSPFVGAEAMVGSDLDGGFAVQLGANVGVMLGSPSLRLELRLQPMLTYYTRLEYGYDYYGSNDYNDHSESRSVVKPNLAVRAGVWISRFNIYLQYHKHVGVGLGWRF